MSEDTEPQEVKRLLAQMAVPGSGADHFTLGLVY